MGLVKLCVEPIYTQYSGVLETCLTLRYGFFEVLGSESVKQESKVANCDWVDHQACSLLQYINVIANLFIMGNYFNELQKFNFIKTRSCCLSN